MRWFCALLTAGAIVSSPWWTGVAKAQSPSEPSALLLNPLTEVRITPVTLTAVRPLEIEGAHANPIPEPSAGFAIALLGSAFLIRRRRALP